MIRTMQQLEDAALRFGLLPFFANDIDGFSVEEMAAPGMLFAENADESGCWEWKGPVIRRQTTAYGKFFKRKAGFVSRALLPHFLNFRREFYPVLPDSPEATILEIIRRHEGLTSTELKRLVFGTAKKPANTRRPSLEGPLQRLQMGGHLLIADFEYKHTRQGRRYGWGTALYSTPRIWFEDPDIDCPGCSPIDSLHFLRDRLGEALPGVSPDRILAFLR